MKSRDKLLMIIDGSNLAHRAYQKFENLKGRFGGKNGILKVGFVGRVVPVKDVETFIRACKIINKELRLIS